MGSGVSKTVHVDQSKYDVCSSSARHMFYFGVVIFGTSLIISSNQPSLLQPKAMAERTRDGGVEECKGFLPPNVPTTRASSTRLPLCSLDLNTRCRVYNTGTATTQRIRRTESQRSADLARKGTKGTTREQKDSACMMLTKNVHGKLGNSSSETWLQRRRPHCKLGTKKRHDWQVNIRTSV